MRKVDNLHDIGMLKHGGGMRLAQDIHDVAGGHAGTVDKRDAFNSDAAAQVRVAANLDGAKTAGRERLERLEPLEQLARAGALQRNVRREPGGMLREKLAWPTLVRLKFVCERRARGRAHSRWHRCC